jgi:hypothetical protein
MLDDLKQLSPEQFDNMFKGKISLYSKEHDCLPTEVQAKIYTDKEEKKVKIALFCKSDFKRFLSLKEDILGIKKFENFNIKHMIVSSVINQIKDKTAEKYKSDKDDVSFVISADSDESDFKTKITLFLSDEMIEDNFSFEGIF